MGIKDRINKVERKLKGENKSNEIRIVIVREGNNEEELVTQAKAETYGQIIVVRCSKDAEMDKRQQFLTIIRGNNG